MPIATIAQTSFTGGEWSPRLHGRVDIAKYQSSCEVLQNFVLYPHGGITRRMGMEYIASAKDVADNTVRLIPFEYNREQAYVLEFGHEYIRFYRDGGQVLDGSSNILEVASPYQADELAEISYTQSADVLYIVHPLYPPRKLERTGPDTFALNILSITGAPTGDFAWDANNGYPRAITFFQNRLVYGGTNKKPMTIWMSRTNLYQDLTIPSSGAIPSDGIQITLSSSQVNAIQWLTTSRKLLVGTTGGEFSIYGASGAGVSAANIQVDRESNFGSRNGRVQLVGLEVLYSSRDAKKLRAMGYSFEKDGYDSPELSILSEHITRVGIKEFDYAQNPDGIVWTVLNDGTFAGFTYLKSQEVQGWHRHETNGEVISVCTIEGDTGSEVWFAVSRNGQINIEKMAPAFEGTDADDVACAYLDSFLTYDGVPSDTISGLDHLEGMEVGVHADGCDAGNKTVTGGSIILEKEASKVVIGLRQKWRVVPLRLEGGSPMGFAQGKKKRIESLTVRVERSAGISHKVPGAQKENELSIRRYGENYDEACPLYSGDLNIGVDNNWSTDGQYELCGNSTLPVTILMVAAKVTVNE